MKGVLKKHIWLFKSAPFSFNASFPIDFVCVCAPVCLCVIAYDCMKNLSQTNEFYYKDPDDFGLVIILPSRHVCLT